MQEETEVEVVNPRIIRQKKKEVPDHKKLAHVWPWAIKYVKI